MKFIFVFFFVSFLVVDFLTAASPVQEKTLNEEILAQEMGSLPIRQEVLSRNKRATCPWFPSACDIHCKSKGFSTGFCRGPTCTCKNH